MAVFSLGGTRSSTTTSGKASGAETSTGQTRVLDTATEEELKGLLTQFSLGATGTGKFTREQALLDVGGQVKQLFTDMSEQYIPKIMEQQATGGGYSGSGAQLLANDAFSRTVAQASTLQTGAIKDYETMNQAGRTLDLQGFSTALQGLLGAKKDTSEQSQFASQNSSKSVGKSVKAGFGIG